MPVVKTRFSPSPTGKLHIGGLRTALYNYLYARQHQGNFLLRLEDTDQSRLVPGAAENVIAGLAWAKIAFDGEVVTQSQRLDLYRTYANQLLAEGSAYRCFCPSERLDLLRRDQEVKKLPIRYDGRCRQLSAGQVAENLAKNIPSVVRFVIPAVGKIECTDIIRGTIAFNFATLDDQIILKTDGFPTYHLASVVDDHAMGITHVIRGEEWIPSLPKHILLYRALGWDPPAFAHLPLLLNPDRSKLSKRTGDVSVDDYRDAGYLPEAVLNFVALLGWNPGTEQEIFSLDELVRQFSLDRIGKSGAVFNRDKLDWINGCYLRQLTADNLVDRALPFLQQAPWKHELLNRDKLRAVVTMEQKRIKRLGELPELISYFYQPPSVDPALVPWRGQTPEAAADKLSALHAFLGTIPPQDFTAPGLEAKLKSYIAANGKSNGEFLWPLRVALTGRQASPGPFEVAAALGRQETLTRIQAAGAALATARPAVRAG